VSTGDLRESGTGDSDAGAETRASLSIGPGRNGVFIAKPWRIWSQGDEFYAAQREEVKAIKVSFHGTEWHLDAAQERSRLAAPLPLSMPGWSLALQLCFLAPNRTMVSPVLRETKRSSNVIGVETSAGRKLVVNLLCAPADTKVTSHIPPELDGVRFMAMQLRSRGVVLVTASQLNFSNDDISLLRNLRCVELKGTATGPHTISANVEHVLADFTSRGNVIRVVPFVAKDIRVVQEAESPQT
jgi:hypothetical protein